MSEFVDPYVKAQRLEDRVEELEAKLAGAQALLAKYNCGLTIEAQGKLADEVRKLRVVVAKRSVAVADAEARLAKVAEAGNRMAAHLPRTLDRPHSVELEWCAAVQEKGQSKSEIPTCCMCNRPLPTDVVIRNNHYFCAKCGLLP